MLKSHSQKGAAVKKSKSTRTRKKTKAQRERENEWELCEKYRYERA